MKREEISCPVDCPNRNKGAVGKGYSILALIATVPSVLAVALLFSLRVDYQCLTKGGVVECDTKVEWQGWKGVPLEAIATALGTGFAVYGTKDKWAEKIGKVFKQTEPTSQQERVD